MGGMLVKSMQIVGKDNKRIYLEYLPWADRSQVKSKFINEDFFNDFEEYEQQYKEVIKLVKDKKPNKDGHVIKYTEYNERLGIFQINKNNLEKLGIKEENNGFVFINDNSKDFYSSKNILGYFKNNTMKYYGDISLLDFKKIKQFYFMDVKSGLSNILLTRTKIGTKFKKTAIFFDIGNMSNRYKYVDKIISFLRKHKIDNLYIIISHFDLDHYSILKLKSFKEIIDKFKVTLITYSHVFSYSISEIVNKYNSHSNFEYISLPMINKEYKMGLITLKTFNYNKNFNKTSMVLHTDKITLLGDQYYELVPRDWLKNNSILQVSHHGSVNSGNYKLIKNNKINFIPNGKSWGIPNVDVIEYAKVNNKHKHESMQLIRIIPIKI